MKINKEELKDIAKKINIDLSENELDTINNSIVSITDKLNEIFEEDTDGVFEKRTSSEKSQDLEEEVIDDYERVDMSKVNNFDGKYVRIKKEQDE